MERRANEEIVLLESASPSPVKPGPAPALWHYPLWGLLCAMVFWANMASGAWLIAILVAAIVGFLLMLRIEVGMRREHPPLQFSINNRESWTNVIAAIAILIALVFSRSFNTSLSWFLGGAALVVLGCALAAYSRIRASKDVSSDGATSETDGEA